MITSMIAAAATGVKVKLAGHNGPAMPNPSAFHWRDFPPERLAAAKGSRLVSVCLPARDEAATVGEIVTALVGLAERWHLVDEILVVDDGSVDRTARVAAEAGAKVVSPGGAPLGKGGAMETAVESATGDVLVFCDADLRQFEPTFVTGLLGPLLVSDRVDFVKGWFERAGEGGRVTELTARPLLRLLHPHLSGFAQPLAGEFAARRHVLEQVPYLQGYGVDLGLLIDVSLLVGVERMAQVFLGRRVHRNRPLSELGEQAVAVARAALTRAGIHVEPAEPGQ
jgi:glucosyl-3-phosphoglycerate synthase